MNQAWIYSSELWIDRANNFTKQIKGFCCYQTLEAEWRDAVYIISIYSKTVATRRISILEMCYLMHFSIIMCLIWNGLKGIYMFFSIRKPIISTKQRFYIYISGGPLSALTCCVNVRLLSAIKKISPLIYSQSWDGSWVYTTQAMMTFTLIF